MSRYNAITTVTLAATSFNLTTIASVQGDLGSIVSNPTDIAYLARIIRQASFSIAAYCNRVFALQSYQDVLKPDGNSSGVIFSGGLEPIVPANIPLVSVDSITVDGVALVADTDYEVDLKKGEIWRLDGSGCRWPWDGWKITMAYKAGFTLPSQTGTDNRLINAAPDIEDAIIRLVKARYLARDRDPYLKVDQVDGVGSQTYWVPDTPDGNMPTDVQEILDQYRFAALA